MTSALLDGRVALVSGAARGIGKAIAVALAEAGAKIVVADNGTGIDGEGADPKAAERAARSLDSEAVPFSESIASPSAAHAAVDLAMRKFGGLDILVNNAAIIRDALVFKGEPRDWDAVIRNNLSAAYYLINAATPIMREQFKAGRGEDSTYNWGRIVNIGSTAGLYGNFGQASYGSAKAGLFGLTRITAMELARSEVTSNLIAPFAHTRVTDTIQPANAAQETYKKRAMAIDADHVATFVAYLCSPAAQKVSGQVFGVRGREIFVFSQPRPAATLVSKDGDWTAEGIAKAADKTFSKHFTDLSTDLEAFNTEPIV